MNFKIYGRYCIIDGRLYRFVCYNGVSRIFEFVNPDGTGTWWVSSEAFDKGVLEME